MTRAAAHALWRAAPVRLVRTPLWFGLVLTALTLLVASVVAPPLFVETGRASALAGGIAAQRGNAFGEDSPDLRVVWDAVLPAVGTSALLDRLDALPAYGPPSLGAAGAGQGWIRRAVAVAGERRAPSVLWYHDGALAALGGDDDSPGVWLDASVARSLHLQVGDRLRIGMADADGGRPSLAAIVLAGTYEPMPSSTLPRPLAGLPDSSRWLLPVAPDRAGTGTPLAVVSRATFDRLVLAVGESPAYTADVRARAGLTPDQAHRTARQVQALGDDAFDSASDLSTFLYDAEPEPARLSLATGLPLLVGHADDTARSAHEQVQPYAVGGQVLAALLLVAAWVLLGRSRRREQLLAAGLGVPPAAQALLAALEALPASLLAIGAGAGLAHVGVLAAGPSGQGPAGGIDWQRAVLAAAGGLLLLALTAGVAALASDRLDRLSRLGRSPRALPGLVALLAATAVVTFGVLSVPVGRRSGSPLTMVFPLVVAAAVAVVVTRAASWVRTRRPGRGRPGSARWLAGRRTGPVLREVTALTAVIALALGLFGYALAVRRGVEQGVGDKTAALVGAQTTLVVADDFRGQGTRRALTPPVSGTTIVWQRGVALRPAFGEGPLMAIDPASFASVADWGDSGDLAPGRALVGRLDHQVRGIPVILSGTTTLRPGNRGSLDFNSEILLPIEVVGVVKAFPGAESTAGAVTVVASARRIWKALPMLDPRHRGSRAKDPGTFASSVWSQDSAAALRTRLDARGIATDGAVATAAEAEIANDLVASSWAASYVLALGVVVLVLAVAAGLVLVIRLTDRDTTSDVLLRRMGFSPRELARARAWEVGYAVTTAVVAAVLSVAALLWAPTTVDAVVRVPPLTRPRAGLTDALAVLGVLAVLVASAWLAGTALARRRSTAEVLRGGG